MHQEQRSSFHPCDDANWIKVHLHKREIKQSLFHMRSAFPQSLHLSRLSPTPEKEADRRRLSHCRKRGQCSLTSTGPLKLPVWSTVTQCQDWTIFLWGSKTYRLKCKLMLTGCKSVLGSSSFAGPPLPPPLPPPFPFFFVVEDNNCLVSGQRPSEENINKQVKVKSKQGDYKETLYK